MENVNIGNTIAEVRNNLSLTQDEVATALGISNKTLSKWENGMSEPNLTMLTRLAEYYNVSTDYILGIKSQESITAKDLIKEGFGNSSFKESAISSFELCFEMLRTKFKWKAGAEETIIPNENIGNYSSPSRSFIQTNEEFELFVNTDDVSMFVQLLGNRNNFAWLDKADKQEKTAKLFKFLSNKDAYKIIKLIHTKTTPRNITSAFVAENTGLDENRAIEILEEGITIGLCEKSIAHLKDKNVTIYIATGVGKLLAIVTLGYEYMCGKNCNDYALSSGSCKMIEGDRK